MAKKTPSKKTPAKKAAKAPKTAAGRARVDSARFERLADIDTLRRAEEVRTDPRRMAGVKREAKEQQKVIARVVKR